jgi:hypothetical protein
MNKALLIAAILNVILLIAILMWPGAGARERSTSVAQAGAQLSSMVAHAEPYATAEAFHAAWEVYLRGGSADSARISETADHHHDWVNAIFPQSVRDFHDGLSLTLGKYRILYPYLSRDVIDDYGILLTEVSNNKPEVINSLIKCGANPNKDFILTAATTPQMIDVLVRDGADPNKPLPDGRSQLQYFRQLGRPDLIDAMIRNGARATP